MGFDFVILAFTTIALMRHSRRTDLWRLLFQDGLVYFLVSFSTNAIPAVRNLCPFAVFRQLIHDFNKILNVLNLNCEQAVNFLLLISELTSAMILQP
jgi:hypothetical protein